MEVEFDALVWLGQTVDGLAHAGAELLVQRDLLLQTELLGAQNVQLVADADQQLLLGKTNKVHVLCIGGNYGVALSANKKLF